jgi:hypothetical protein
VRESLLTSNFEIKSARGRESERLRAVVTSVSAVVPRGRKRLSGEGVREIERRGRVRDWEVRFWEREREVRFCWERFLFGYGCLSVTAKLLYLLEWTKTTTTNPPMLMQLFFHPLLIIVITISLFFIFWYIIYLFKRALAIYLYICKHKSGILTNKKKTWQWN